jgi:hypothetical protein
MLEKLRQIGIMVDDLQQAFEIFKGLVFPAWRPRQGVLIELCEL